MSSSEMAELRAIPEAVRSAGQASVLRGVELTSAEMKGDDPASAWQCWRAQLMRRTPLARVER
jgi:hypothetical protein